MINISNSKWLRASAWAAVTTSVGLLTFGPAFSAEWPESVVVTISGYAARIPVTQYLSLDYFEGSEKIQISLHPSPSQERMVTRLAASAQPLRLESGTYDFRQIERCDKVASDLMACSSEVSSAAPTLRAIEFGPVAGGPRVESYYDEAARRARGLGDLLTEANMTTVIVQSNSSEIAFFCDQYLESSDSYLCRSTRQPTSHSRFTFNYMVPRSGLTYGVFETLAAVSSRFLDEIEVGHLDSSAN